MSAVAQKAVAPARATRPGARVLDVVAWTVIGIDIVLVALGPVLAPHDPNQGDLLAIYAPPSPEHILGTDSLGRDIFSRLIVGARTSLLGPVIVVALSLVLAAPLGILAAWKGGTVAALTNRLFDVLFAAPAILVAILATAVFGPGLSTAVLAIAVAFLPYMGRVVYTSARQQRAMPYVDALRVHGVGAWAIAFRHILPNSMPVIRAQLALLLGYAMLDLAALSFLGFGVQAPQADWGAMVNAQGALLDGQPMEVIAATIAIVATVLALLRISEMAGPDRTVLARRRFPFGPKQAKNSGGVQ